MSHYRKPSLEGFEPYVPGLQPGDGEAWTKLNTNESPFPAAPGVGEAIAQQVERLQLYPDPMQTEFRLALSQVYDVAPDQVVGGNGGDEVLAMAVRAFVSRDRGAAYLEPAYTLVPKLLMINEVRGEEHAFADGYRLPKSFIDSEAALKFLVNPNSPTGTLLPLDDVAELCRRSRGVIILDEAYVDFAPRNGLEILDQHPNLMLVRSMSKSYGLAGLRVGFAIARADLVADLWAVKDICNLGRLPLAAATAALKDRDHWRRTVERVVENRERLSEELRSRGWQVLPSGANFVFATPPRPAMDVYRELTEQRVLVRHFPRPSVAHGLRISIGTWEQCEALLDALDGLS